MTRTDYLAELDAALVANPHNVAIRMHRAKVEKMTEVEFVAHYLALTSRDPARDRAIASMARSIVRKTRR